jgi:ATP-dependent helicase/nuclease subunit A
MTSATDPQLLASEPGLSASVRANAGSGKTWTLIARVARLLLADSRPEAILCVTYTKAAAAEMQRRLFATLGQWAVMEDDVLAKELAIYGEATGDLSRARKLFAQALETPGGLKIQTIHAFCEKLLRRFPLEAGVSPGFEVLDDATTVTLARQARDSLALIADARPGSDLARAYTRMAVNIDLRGFDNMLAAFVRHRERLAILIEAGRLEAIVHDKCDVDPNMSDAEIVAPAMTAISIDVLRLAANLFAASGGKTDQSCAVELFSFIEMHTAGGAPFDAAIAVFATAKGDPRKHYETSATLRAEANVHAALLDIRDQLFGARKTIRAAEIARDSLAVMRLGATYAALHGDAKRALGGLDFDDLISRTRALLTVRSGAAWALYKLDGGIDHILLDEAQDTAGGQWDILRALTGEFFSGAGLPGRDETGRTVFFVGDEKQSIYGFNGAAPERLLGETVAYDQLVTAAGRTFAAIDLKKSRRSAPQVLAFIDAVSNLPEVRAGLQPGVTDGAPIEHQRHRTEPGCVELWPLEEADPPVELDPWLPVDAEPPESANKKLARRMATEIARIIASGEGGAGDIMILVRRRKALFEEIIRALKQRGVPVAGADRLKLSAHIAFQDLLALARFCLYPDDDLTLAALLRSPFCDVDEEGLYDLAQGRKGHLWAVLDGRSGERPEWEAAHSFLSWARSCAARLSPFDFYGRVLNRQDGAGRTMRARMLTRLGAEAADVLDAFMAQALATEQAGARALEAFVAAMGGVEIEIKREQDEASGVVRVMTVHGAKGLEAPIVFLPDTTTVARPASEALFDVGDAFLWAPRADDDCEVTLAAREARKTANTEESMRLLYVAMTRARDRLVVAGVGMASRKLKMDEGSWYDLIERAITGDALEGQTRQATLGGMRVTRVGPDPAPAAVQVAREVVASAIPAWLSARPKADPSGLRYVSPSALAENLAQDAAASPLIRQDGLGRFRRGELIHRLLQLLPDIAPPARPAAAASLLAREPGLTDAQRSEMITAAFGVLDDARFAAVFGPGSRSEVAVAGQAKDLPKGLAVGGRLDRLVVEPNRVLVVDFKTNRPSPDSITDADPAYVTQMAAYAAVLREAFPGRSVEAALVWTDGPKLMAVPENMLTAALAKLSLTP